MTVNIFFLIVGSKGSNSPLPFPLIRGIGGKIELSPNENCTLFYAEKLREGKSGAPLPTFVYTVIVIKYVFAIPTTGL
jgi:hypothetical protein